jgi:hypothetical protein
MSQLPEVPGTVQFTSAISRAPIPCCGTARGYLVINPTTVAFALYNAGLEGAASAGDSVPIACPLPMQAKFMYSSSVGQCVAGGDTDRRRRLPAGVGFMLTQGRP